MIRIGSMCSGFGGLELALAAALAPGPVSTAWHCEVDPAAGATLEKHQPGTPNHGDLTKVDWSRVEPVDVLAMGVPCQAVSAAGRQLVEADPRWLWPAAYAGLLALRPRLVVFENVRNLISIRGGEVWATILNDLRSAGYAVRWLTLGACAVGAPHHRHRVFAVALHVGHDRYAPVRVDAPECGARRGALLASPLARDGEGRNEGDAAYWERKRARGFNGGIPLGAQVGLLPTPTTADGVGGRSVDTRERHNGRPLGASVLDLLPSPQARDGGNGRGTPDATLATARLAAGRRNLDDAVGSLLPTPKAQDARNGLNYVNNRGEPGGLAAVDKLDLIPTPRASDAKNGGPNQGIASGDIALSSAVIGERWGKYAAAVARWEGIISRSAPEPTEVGPRGGRRLAATLPEWMMGLPSGYLSGHLGRSDALRLAGNGVCPQQGAAAIDLLLSA
jgi:DNA (cytosine-5)-methyltransferase 1